MKPIATAQQPIPEKNDSPAVWPLVIASLDGLERAPLWIRQVVAEDMRARDEFGRQKYGMPLQVVNGRDAGIDAYQEALDLCAYARQREEQTGLPFWAAVSGQALGLVASIRYQLALEEEERKAHS